MDRTLLGLCPVDPPHPTSSCAAGFTWVDGVRVLNRGLSLHARHAFSQFGCMRSSRLPELADVGEHAFHLALWGGVHITGASTHHCTTGACHRTEAKAAHADCALAWELMADQHIIWFDNAHDRVYHGLSRRWLARCVQWIRFEFALPRQQACISRPSMATPGIVSEIDAAVL